MKEIFGDIWEIWADSQMLSYPILKIRYDAIAITTNGFVKKNGAAVMGRGIAKQVKDNCPGIDDILGQKLKKFGNHVLLLEYAGFFIPQLITFPVKPEYGPNFSPGWREKADPALIERSAHELMELLNLNYFGEQPYKYWNVLLPRPGCGNGRLKWENVKPIIEPILDDRITIISKGE